MQSKTDLFTNIHKAIRAVLFETASMLQRGDFADESEKDRILQQLELLFVLLHDHADHEDNLIFPAIERVAPGITDLAEAQHHDYELQMRRLEALMEQLRLSNHPEERIRLGIAINQAFDGFLAFSLIHLKTEEENILPVSLELLSEEELVAIRSRILSSIPPDISAVWMRYMLPSLNFHEKKKLAQVQPSK